MIQIKPTADGGQAERGLVEQEEPWLGHQARVILDTIQQAVR